MGWLVTGGCGYIGAHVVRELTHSGYEVVVLDDLSTGRPERLPDTMRVHVGTVLDTPALTNLMRAYRVDGVVHLAGKKAVDESVKVPLHYYEENVWGMHSLLTSMHRTGVRRLVFSSTAAVYGAPPTRSVTEDSPTCPVSPYGRTKLACEWMMRDAAQAQGLAWAALRYFNVAGAASADLADDSASNLIPRVLRAVQAGETPTIYGDDYATPDGTCIRDYVHAADVASAHVAVVDRLQADGGGGHVFNVGRGEGSSVLEVMRTIQQVSGQPFSWQIAPRRPGDPAELVARTDRIQARLGWSARHGLPQIVHSAWTGSCAVGAATIVGGLTRHDVAAMGAAR